MGNIANPAGTTDVAIIGAGVVGMAIAERLLQDGREVTLIDPGPPGGGASYGNAGTIADYAVNPVGTPDVLRNLPALLFSRTSPLAIRHAAIPSLVPWLMRFVRQSLPAAAYRNSLAIASLLADAGGRWEDLSLRVSGQGLTQRRGCLYAYETAKAFQAATSDMTFRRALGVRVDLLDGAALAGMEPALPPMAGAAYFPDAVFLSDPGQMMALLANQVRMRAQIVVARVDRLTRQRDAVALAGPGLQLRAKTVILAAGAHSRNLALQAGDRIPLDTERGYHVEWDMPKPRLNRPVSPTTRGFYLCPMDGRLRVAGTVELGGLRLPASPHRIAQLIAGARAIFPDLGAPDRSWMGFRPSLPDSLPVIGPSRAGPEVIHAFGHGHLGVTLAPVTAEIVAALVAGNTAHMDIHPFRANRF